MQCADRLRDIQNPFAKLPTASSGPSNVKFLIGHSNRVSSPQNVIRGIILKDIEILPSPNDHLLDTLLQTNLRLPPDILLDCAAIQPVLTILTKSIPGNFAKVVERNFEPFSDFGDQVTNGNGRGRPGVINFAQRRFF